MSESKKNIFESLKNDEFKEILIDALSISIPEDYLPAFKELMLYVINEKMHLFNRKEFYKSYYNEEMQDLILPAIRRVFGKIFITTPDIFKKTLEGDNRHKLYKLYFNIDEFIDYLVDMLIKCRNSLKNFTHIDRSAETLTLIVDNYISKLITKVKECNNVDEEIVKMERDLKLLNILDK